MARKCYRVRCVTEAAWVETWQDAKPTVCPNDGGHTIDEPATVICAVRESQDTVAPTVNDDVTGGYTVGSLWYDTAADRAYICLDPADGAAVWIEITQGGESYVDRGDPAAVDASIGSGLTADGTWRTLDLSSIVPAGAASKLVHLRCRILDNSTESMMQLRKVGNTNAINAAKVVTAITNDSIYLDAWVMLDSARAIEYNIDSNMNNAEITVAGWMV